MVSATIPLKRVYISVINDLVTDQRVHRVVDLLQGRGMEVTCIGRRLPHSPGLEGVSFRYRRYRMLFTKGPLFYACYNARLLLTLLTARKPSLFIANDLDTLPAGFMANFDVLLRMDDNLSIERNREVAELLAKGIIGL